jgi:DNA-directed RNA polymerase subunit RPC12/RpoP
MYLIFRCGDCGRHLYAEKEIKTRTCPCGKRVNLKRVRILARARDAREAGEAVRALQLKGRKMSGFSPAGGSDNG